jgi:PAS domain S-box-containing protein
MRALKTPKVDILVVDDRPSDRLVVESILKDPFYNLVMAGSGKEALRRVLEGEFAVILLDVMLPDMEGFEVARIIKQRERSRDTPIIFLTAAGADTAFIYRGYSVGAVDYLTKPLDQDVLRAKVSTFVELHRKDRRIQEQAEALIAADRRARAQEVDELRQASERRYRELAEAISPVVWTATPDGAVTYFNRRWQEYTGQGDDAALGWGWVAALHPDDSRSREESWRAALATMGVYEAECRIRGVDGNFRWYVVRAVPERNAEGIVVGWLGTYADIDDLKRAHEAAEAARHRSELRAEVSAVLSSTLDEREQARRGATLTVPRLADACVVELFAEDTLEAGDPIIEAGESELGARLTELRSRWGVDWLVDVHKTGRPELVRKVTDDALRALAHDEEHGTLLRQLGSTSIISVPLVIRERIIGSITFLARGRHYGEADLELALDIAHRAALAVDNARLYRGARHAVAQRDEFLSIASHELRTPLTSLQLQLQTLERQLERGDASHAPDKVEKAIKQTRRLEKLIANLLDVSRILAGRMELELEDVDLGDMVRELAERFGEDAAHAGCRLEVVIRAVPVGSWDRIRIEQVLTNLLANAVRYAPGAPIEIELDGRDGRARVSVIDHGPGVSPAVAARIFERFERAAGPHHGGLGLGLYIARHIVESHGGTLTLATRGPSGAAFTMELPATRITPRA